MRPRAQHSGVSALFLPSRRFRSPTSRGRAAVQDGHWREPGALPAAGMSALLRTMPGFWLTGSHNPPQTRHNSRHIVRTRTLAHHIATGTACMCMSMCRTCSLVPRRRNPGPIHLQFMRLWIQRSVYPATRGRVLHTSGRELRVAGCSCVSVWRERSYSYSRYCIQP